MNIRRIGYVASEITKARGSAVCAAIAPYEATRNAVREMVELHGGFVEVHVATSVEECEKRDRKGLYALARQGKIKGFTGIDDPYEAPPNPEVLIATNTPIHDAVDQIMEHLESEGYFGGKPGRP